jgi:hypothetical protein
MSKIPSAPSQNTSITLFPPGDIPEYEKGRGVFKTPVSEQRPFDQEGRNGK